MRDRARFGGRWALGVALVLVLAALGAHPVQAQGDFDFWISEELLQRVVDGNTLVVPLEMDLGARSKVHPLKSDCELHLAAVPVENGLTSPEGWVVEPPYLCNPKNKPPVGNKWDVFYDDNFVNQDNCTVFGFPRILDEHLRGEETPTNPHHAFEIHPAVKLTCGETTTDFTKFLTHLEGMSEIKPASAAKCFEMEVRVRRSVDRRNEQRRTVELQVDRPSNCGNFFAFEMAIFPDWIRAIDRDNPTTSGHSALVRVKPEGSDRTRTLKIYTMPGTPEDEKLRQWLADWEAGGEENHHGAFFHGLTTIDYFQIWKAITNRAGDLEEVADWKDVDFPLAMVVYGTVADPDPEEHEEEDFHE